jgi:D-alanyl-D-alanine carboxypeptidase
VTRVSIFLLSVCLSLAGCQNTGCNSPLYRSVDRMHPPVDLTDARAPEPDVVPEAIASQLRTEWARLQDDEGIEHLAIAVSGPAGDWYSPLPDGVERFYWASVGKLATAVLVQQLVQENSLQLDQRLSQWYPNLPGANAITLEMLLSHRAGFTSHNEFEEFRRRSSPATPEEVVRFLEARPLLFCPGTDWYYSNSGYVLLGRIIERATGKSFRNSVATRIAEPIGASSLTALAQGESPPDVAVPTRPPSSSEPLMAPGDPFSAGNIVASPQDMVRFLAAVLDGRLVPATALNAMGQQLYPMFEERLYYGLGLMTYDLPEATWVGHSGGTPGAKAVVVYSLEKGTYAAVALTGEGSAESIARLFMSTVEAPATTANKHTAI